MWPLTVWIDLGERLSLELPVRTRARDANYESCNIFPHAHTMQLVLRAEADPDLMDLRSFSPLTYSRLPNTRTCALTITRPIKFQIEGAAITKLLWASHSADGALSL